GRFPLPATEEWGEGAGFHDGDGIEMRPDGTAPNRAPPAKSTKSFSSVARFCSRRARDPASRLRAEGVASPTRALAAVFSIRPATVFRELPPATCPPPARVSCPTPTNPFRTAKADEWPAAAPTVPPVRPGTHNDPVDHGIRGNRAGAVPTPAQRSVATASASRWTCASAKHL